MPKGLISVTRGLLSVIGIILIIDCTALMVVGKVNFGSVVPFLVGIVLSYMEFFGMQYAGFAANIMASTAFGMGYGLYLYFGY